MSALTPEITATHVLAALSPNAPTDVVIAITDDEHRVLVGSAASMRHWRGHWQATPVATRSELFAALSPQQRRDIAAIDAHAEQLTDRAAVLVRPAVAA